MKKMIMLLLLLLGLGGAGAGYYMFYYAPEHGSIFDMYISVGKKPEAAPPVNHAAVEAKDDMSNPEIMDYYVHDEMLPIRRQPVISSFIEGHLYRGDKVHLLEKRSGWGRISEYFVYQEGKPATAKWVPLDGLHVNPPNITSAERRKTILSYIEKSDDIEKYQETFVKTTDDLLNKDRCKPDDFKEIGGWVRSVNFENEDVYFVYCGGMSRVNKIYLNAQSGQVFEPDNQ
ncbi:MULTISPECIES: SH3 domain-containing protein [Vibrio]|uniref:SH3 domain protein n=2 Tax=Vibrio TaxID=662 RepID=A0A7X4RUD6_9VIBR|nr:MULTISPECIES: hypothetical protein [Vibrio]MZI92979.1 hypothetical protein [Vibrio eleionomae]